MRPDEIVAAVDADLRRFAETRPGVRARVATATDPWHVLELLTTGPQGRLLVLFWAGDSNASEFPQAPIPKHALEIYVGHNLGLALDPGKVLTQGTEDRPGLLRFLWEVRRRVRGLMLDPIQTSTLFEYQGTDPVSLPNGVPLAAYKARFTIEVSEDEPGEEPDWADAQ